jgi:primosomal protein N' (replication factor Y)
MKKKFTNQEIVSVLTTEPVGKLLAYKVPKEGCSIGSFVSVPLGSRIVLGVVWSSNFDKVEHVRLKTIVKVLNINPISTGMIRFIERFSSYTMTPYSATLRLVTRVTKLDSPNTTIKKYSFLNDNINGLSPTRLRVLNYMKNNSNSALQINQIIKECKVSSSVIRGLTAVGALKVCLHDRDISFPELNLGIEGKKLSKDQKLTVESIKSSKAFNTVLLKGVTGSGKTEVYLECIADCLRQKKQALVLLPEIGLTPEFICRVEERFGARPGEWHSGVSQPERRRVWKMASEGGVQLVVGARSALFLPFVNLGLIVVDEEHDQSYKQDDGVLYNARDMAVLRGSITSAKVILASATPSLESWVNVRKGKYLGVELNSRFGGASIPKIKAIDMRLEKLDKGKWISPSLIGYLQEKLQKGEQSLLFLNRRGYAPITLCRACGEQVSCKQCDSRMVEHRHLNRIMCHQCGDTRPIPQKCLSCHSEGTLSAIGPGIERLALEVEELFPEAKVAVLSSDLLKTPAALKEKLNAVTRGSFDIIVGTQLVAKGHNFPNLTLVGVIDADLGLQGADLRAAERTFQLINQVSGRGGRKTKLGTTFIQTFQPKHRVIKAIIEADIESFWSQEANDREIAKVPPFGRFASIILSGVNLKNVEEAGRSLLKNSAGLEALGMQVFGPAPAPISLVKGKYRQRMLIKSNNRTAFQLPLSKWISGYKNRKGVIIKIDIDPYNFL